MPRSTGSKMHIAVITSVALLSFVSSAMLTGGIQEIEPDKFDNDQSFKTALSKAAVQYNRMSNSMFAYGVTSVNHVTKQIVQGVKYEAIVTFGPTNCRKSSDLVSNISPKCTLMGS